MHEKEGASIRVAHRTTNDGRKIDEIYRRNISEGKKHTLDIVFKVPKCEIFDLFDFNDFYVIKSL
jgi:hypothetical protein